MRWSGLGDTRFFVLNSSLLLFSVVFFSSLQLFVLLIEVVRWQCCCVVQLGAGFLKVVVTSYLFSQRFALADVTAKIIFNRNRYMNVFIFTTLVRQADGSKICAITRTRMYGKSWRQLTSGSIPQKKWYLEWQKSQQRYIWNKQTNMFVFLFECMSGLWLNGFQISNGHGQKV